MQHQSDSLRSKVTKWIGSKEVKGDSNDTNYIFLRFVVDYLPVGLVGLLIAIIFLQIFINHAKTLLTISRAL